MSEAIPKHTTTNGTRFDAGASERQGFATARARYATDASSLAACTSWPTRINEDKGRTRKGCKGCHGKGSTHEVERTTLLPGNHTRHQEAPQRIGEAAGSVRKPSCRRVRKRYRCWNEPQGNRRNVLEKPLREPPPMLLRPAHQGHSGLQDQDERSHPRRTDQAVVVVISSRGVERFQSRGGSQVHGASAATAAEAWRSMRQGGAGTMRWYH